MAARQAESPSPAKKIMSRDLALSGSTLRAGPEDVARVVGAPHRARLGTRHGSRAQRKRRKRSLRPVPACQNSRASSSRRSTRPAHAPRSRPTRRSRRGRVRRAGASARPARARSACTRGSVLERTPPHPRARAEALDAARTGGGGHAGGHRAGEAARDGWAGRGERGATKTSSRSSGVPHFVRSRAPYSRGLRESRTLSML